jgi:hypothetical protein
MLTDYDFLEEASDRLPHHLGILWSTIGQSSSSSWVTSACYYPMATIERPGATVTTSMPGPFM